MYKYVQIQGVRKEKWRVENNGHSAEVELLETHTDRVGFWLIFHLC